MTLEITRVTKIIRNNILFMDYVLQKQYSLSLQFPEEDEYTEQ